MVDVAVDRGPNLSFGSSDQKEPPVLTFSLFPRNCEGDAEAQNGDNDTLPIFSFKPPLPKCRYGLGRFEQESLKQTDSSLRKYCTHYCQNMPVPKPCSLEKWLTDDSFRMSLSHVRVKEFREVFQEVNIMHAAIAALAGKVKVFSSVSLTRDNVLRDNRQLACAQTVVKFNYLFDQIEGLKNKIAADMEKVLRPKLDSQTLKEIFDLVQLRSECSRVPLTLAVQVDDDPTSNHGHHADGQDDGYPTYGSNAETFDCKTESSDSFRFPAKDDHQASDSQLCLYSCALCRLALSLLSSAFSYYYFFYIWELLNYRLTQLARWKDKVIDTFPQKGLVKLRNGKHFKWCELMFQLNKAVDKVFGPLSELRAKLEQLSEILEKKHKNFIQYARLVIAVMNRMNLQQDSNLDPVKEEATPDLSFPDLKQYTSVIRHRVTAKCPVKGSITKAVHLVRITENGCIPKELNRGQIGTFVKYILHLLEYMNQVHSNVPQRVNIGCAQLFDFSVPLEIVPEAISLTASDKSIKVCTPSGCDIAALLDVDPTGIFDIDLESDDTSNVVQSTAIPTSYWLKSGLLDLDEQRVLDGSAMYSVNNVETLPSFSLMCTCDWHIHADSLLSSQFRTAVVQGPHVKTCFNNIDALAALLAQLPDPPNHLMAQKSVFLS